MRLLLDECLPKGLATQLPGHEVMTVPQAGWASVKNGRLLRHIADSRKFDIFLTVDKNLPAQNRTDKLPFAIVVLCAKSSPALGLLVKISSDHKRVILHTFNHNTQPFATHNRLRVTRRLKSIS